MDGKERGGMTEHEVQSAIRQKLSNGDTRLFRNNVGKCRDARGQWIQYGIPGPGGSDLIGWHTVTITPAMTGQKIAVFAAVEVKAPGGRARPEQINFIETVRRAGGIAGIAHSPNEAYDLIQRF